MKNKLKILLSIVLLAGCSSQITKETAIATARKAEQDNRKKALEKFIDGSVSEAKGELNEAVNKYLEALQYDLQPGICYSLAKNYFRLNKLSSALNYSRKAVELEPDNVEYLMLLGAIYSASHQEDSAVVVYNNVVELDSTEVSAYFSLAQLNEKSRPNLAVSQYKKILELIGPEWSVLVRLVDLNDRIGNISETINTFEELIKLNPSDLYLQKVLIDSYIKIKEYDKALVKVDEALISFPDDQNLIELKGNALAQKGLMKDAAKVFLKLVKNPDLNFESKMRIGFLFLSESEKDSTNLLLAKEIFETINSDTLDWQVNAYLGEIAIRQKQDSTAVKYLKKATELAEWNPQVWIRLGGLLFDSRKYKEAILFMSEASKKFPNDFAINLVYGLSLSQDSEHLQAAEALKRALKINPNNVTTLSSLGYSLHQLKNDEEALFHLEKALRLEPNNLQVLSVTALVHESNKNFVISDSLYNYALEIDSSNALILNNYAYSLAERGVRLDFALKMAEQAVEKEPENASYLDTIGWVYFKLGDYKLAKEKIEKALKIEEKNATIIDHLGDVYFKLGDKAKAKNLWKKAFETDQNKIEIKEKIEEGEL